jgi:hypothetical protein
LGPSFGYAVEGTKLNNKMEPTGQCGGVFGYPRGHLTFHQQRSKMPEMSGRVIEEFALIVMTIVGFDAFEMFIQFFERNSEKLAGESQPSLARRRNPIAA